VQDAGTQENHHGRRQAAAMMETIPENDGMQSLRQQLLQIKELALSTEEKAKRMHELMTRDYISHMAAFKPLSPTASTSPPQTPLEPEGNSLAPPVNPDNPYNIRPGDLEVNYSPLPAHPIDAHDGAEEEDTLPDLGCMHYKRNVKVQCFDCRQWYACRHCHDAAHDLPFAHNLNRKKTQNMLCMLCKTPQPAGETCMKCGEYAAWYYCDKCKLWDNDSNKRIYHCDDCGLCRLGEGLGKDFVHCRRCNVCISISTSDAHPCIERATDSDCPLCLSYLFESPTPVVSLPCGHYMHGSCYKDLMAVTYKCPVCSKSAVNMELQWRKLDDEISMQPMPEEDGELEDLLPHLEGVTTNEAEGVAETTAPLRRPRRAWISCNDCNSRCWTPFHWLGLKCHYCGGYNTNQMPPMVGRETEAERLIRQQQLQPRQHDFTGNSVLLDAGIGVGAPSSDDGDRVDSAFGMPSSPSNLHPATAAALGGSPSYNVERRASGAHSPRRYFVQPDEPRRASFTAPRFPTPSMPNMPNMNLPRIPDLPSLPAMPNLPNMPNMPNLPNLPNMPNMPNLPNMPAMPHLPNMPNLELPRFSPYEMVQALSRSLSPMRYYMEGLDMSDLERMGGVAARPPLARRSHSEVPAGTPDETPEEKRPRTTEDLRTGFWGGEGTALVSSSEEEEEEGSGSESEDDDDEDEDVGDLDDGEDEGEDPLALFGHR